MKMPTGRRREIRSSGRTRSEAEPGRQSTFGSPRRALDGADLAPDWAAGAHDGNRLARLAGPTRDQRIVAPIGDPPWLGTGYGTLPEVFRNTAPSTIAAAGSDVTMKRGPV
jgi:hypothetical protein